MGSELAELERQKDLGAVMDSSIKLELNDSVLINDSVHPECCRSEKGKLYAADPTWGLLGNEIKIEQPTL